MTGTLEWGFDSPVTVHAPEGNMSLTVQLRVPRTAIPPSGMEIEATAIVRAAAFKAGRLTR
jgi:hypothetical protein